MGEAKRSLELVRQTFLEEIEKWAFPISEWETQLVEELRTFPVSKVTRYPDHVLEYMKMPARQCHANARFMQENDPEGRLRHVTGWWIQEDNYVLHSVVDQYGELVCVTPAPFHLENPFDFVPDPKIEWRDEGEIRESYRNGIRVGPGVRSDPVHVLANLQTIRERLESGINPYKAVQVDGMRIPGQLSGA